MVLLFQGMLFRAARQSYIRMASSTTSSHQGRKLQPTSEQVERITQKIDEVRNRISKAIEQSHRNTKVS